MTQSPKTATPPPSERFSPIILPSSPAELVNQKNITGLPRIVRDLAADIYNSIQKWNSKHITGAAIVQQIATLKSHSTEQLPCGLEALVKQLLDVVQHMQTDVNTLVCSKNQITSLLKIQRDDEPLFMLLSLQAMAKIVHDIVESYENEFKAKEYILENIAYARTKQEVMFFSANWAHQIHIRGDVSIKLEKLLIETGHRPIV